MTAVSPTKYVELLKKCEQYESICKQYENTVADLRNRIGDLERRLESTMPNSSTITHSNANEYYTDEEELEKEVAQIRRTEENNKKRKLNEILTPPQANQEKMPRQQFKARKEPLPPPINVSNIQDFNVLRAKVLTVTEKSPQFKAISNNDIKITVQNENDYRAIKRLLKELKENESDDPNNLLNKMQYHTYQIKSERCYRIVVRGLPASTDCDDIKKAIEEKNHSVASVVNVYKKSIVNDEKIIKYFPLFYVDLMPKENNKEVFEIKDLLHCKITIESPKKVNGIPQCTNCQQLGHTKNFCNREAKCVKCAGDHHTRECKKPRNITPSCILCGQRGHPASYKGCEAYQKKLKTQQPKKMTAVQRLQQKTGKQNEPNKQVISGVSYAQTVKAPAEKQSQDIVRDTASNEPSIKDMMKMLSEIQTEMRTNFSQLANRVEQLENNSKLPPTKNLKNKNKNDR